VDEGDAVGVQLVALDRPAVGDQEQETPPEPERGVDPPGGILALPEATAVGRGLTVTVTEGAFVEAQPAADVTVRV